jgi:hypothetical protein
VFWSPLYRGPTFGGKICILAGHRPVIKILNIEYEKNTSSRSGAGYAHTRMYIHIVTDLLNSLLGNGKHIPTHTRPKMQ